MSRQIYPPIKWQFHRFLWNSYFIPTLTAQHLADQVFVDLPPSSKAISQIPALLWEFIFGRPSVGRSTPCQMAILQISAQDHISFLLWELNIWQTRSWQNYPHLSGYFHWFLLWQLLFHSYSESLSFGRPGLGRSTPSSMAILQIPALLWELILSRPPCQMVILQIPALTAHYSKISTFDRPGLGRITPIWVDISLIPTLTAHISFLLWELNIWQTRSWQNYPHLSGYFTDSYSDSSYFIPTLRNHIWQTWCWQIYLPIKQQFHRYLLYYESSY